MPKGLFVDYGGVLTTPILESFAAFCRDESLDPDIFRDAVLRAARAPDSPFAKVEVGAISLERFDEEVAALLSDACGKAIDAAGLKQRMFARVQPDEQMVEAVRSARSSGVVTALVSNSWGGEGYPRETFDELFDVVIISGDCGLRKPEPPIYELALERAGVEPSSAVFVDDFAVNVDGARAVGMHGVLHRDAVATIPLLEAFLGVRLRSEATADRRRAAE